jgi:hypothetical protein
MGKGTLRGSEVFALELRLRKNGKENDAERTTGSDTDGTADGR